MDADEKNVYILLIYVYVFTRFGKRKKIVRIT